MLIQTGKKRRALRIVDKSNLPILINSNTNSKQEYIDWTDALKENK